MEIIFLKKCGDALKNITSNINSSKSNESKNSNSENNEKSFENQNNNFSDLNENAQNDTSSSAPEFDINMIIKMKNIMESMKNNKNDPRANLLKSLKPYLNKNRKEKIDQYIQLFNMSKVFEVMNPKGR